MADGGMRDKDLLEALLELAHEAELEVRILSNHAAATENALTQSAAARVGARIWVVLAPNDPAEHQARVLAETLARHRAEFLESRFVAPALRDFIDRVDPREH